MADPSPEVLAAALALAASADNFVRTCASYGSASAAIEADNRLTADVARYRAAITPKLRTRAEVDAEIARVVHMYLDTEGCPTDALQLVHTLRVLCREETAHDRSNP